MESVSLNPKHLEFFAPNKTKFEAVVFRFVKKFPDS